MATQYTATSLTDKQLMALCAESRRRQCIIVPNNTGASPKSVSLPSINAPMPAIDENGVVTQRKNCTIDANGNPVP